MQPFGVFLQVNNIDAFCFQVCNFLTYFISIYKDKHMQTPLYAALLYVQSVFVSIGK